MSPTYPSISDLRTAVTAPPTTLDKLGPAWRAKMLHAVPDLPIIPDRGRYLAEAVTGKAVLDLGSTGEIATMLRSTARIYHGVTKTAHGEDVVLDLDEAPERIPVYPDVEVVVAAELLEHLANPGRFLAALRVAYPRVPVYLTVPQAGAYQVAQGTYEVVNRDHVAWYSYTTLMTLLTRYGYTLDKARWYHGPPHKAEGLLVVVT